MGRRSRAPVVGWELECERGVKGGDAAAPGYHREGCCKDYGHGMGVDGQSTSSVPSGKRCARVTTCYQVLYCKQRCLSGKVSCLKPFRSEWYDYAFVIRESELWEKYAFSTPFLHRNKGGARAV
jgi:hypothetical protein